MKPHIFFFADISPSIGSGHFWRSMRLAQAIKGNCPSIQTMLMAPDNPSARQAIKNLQSTQNTLLPNFILQKAPENPEKPFDALPAGYSRCFPCERTLTIIDSYRFNKDELMRLENQGPVGIVDDFGHIPDLGSEHVNLILNANNPTPSYQSNDKLTVFDQPHYHFIPDTLFVPQPRNPDSLVITFGATDTGQISFPLLEAMWSMGRETMEKLQTTLALTCPPDKQTHHAPELIKAMGPNLSIIRRYDPADLFNRNGTILCAGGQTVGEARAAGMGFAGMIDLNHTQTLVCRWAAENAIPTHDQNKPDALPIFAQACLETIQKMATVTLPRQRSDGLAKLACALSIYVNGS